MVWDAGGIDWDAFEHIVLRSVWDYHLRLTEFAAWLDAHASAGRPLLNPAGLVRWNLHKSYLDDLAAAGCRVIETARVGRGTPPCLARLLDERGWNEVVVKPAVSASAHRTFRVRRDAAGEADTGLAAILEEGDALVQPLAPEILSSGEWSIVFLGGAFSHAVRKRAAPGEFRVQEEYGGQAETRDPGPDLRAQAAEVLARAPGRTAYARVDGVDREGRFVLMELELIEPVLYLGRDPAAPARLAAAILSWA